MTAQVYLTQDEANQLTCDIGHAQDFMNEFECDIGDKFDEEMWNNLEEAKANIENAMNILEPKFRKVWNEQ